jgi:phage terminase small subunit
VRLDSAILINPNESWGLNIMSVLGNPRYERAAQVLASGGSAETAAAAAGYNTKGTSFKPNARRLIQRPDIRARVAELQGQIAAAMVIDAAWIRTRVARIADVKVDPEDIGASDVIAASRLLAQMTPGAIVPTKVEASGADGDPIEVNMDARSLARTILGIIREASADAPPEADTDTETEPQE